MNSKLIPLLNRLAHPFVKFILRTPFHSLLSDTMLLLTVTGRRSGKQYTFPVNYMRDGDTLVVISWADRTWWKNVYGGADVSVRFAGQWLRAHAESFVQPEAIAEGIAMLSRRVPAFQQRFGSATTPENEQLTQLAQKGVFVLLTDITPATAEQPALASTAR